MFVSLSFKLHTHWKLQGDGGEKNGGEKGGPKNVSACNTEIMDLWSDSDLISLEVSDLNGFVSNIIGSVSKQFNTNLNIERLFIYQAAREGDQAACAHTTRAPA